MRIALNALERLIAVVIGCAFLFALALNFSNVVGRYVFHAPIFWAEEAMIYTFVWCVFLGAALVALRGNHLRVELLEWVLPERTRRALAILSHLVTIVLMTFVAWRAWILVALVQRVQQTSIVAEIPMTVPYGAVFIGSGLLALASLVRVLELTAGVKRPSEPASLPP
jgi:TRAP-type C4-dicarboxylate transport system permease small subunit